MTRRLWVSTEASSTDRLSAITRSSAGRASSSRPEISVTSAVVDDVEDDPAPFQGQRPHVALVRLEDVKNHVEGRRAELRRMLLAEEMEPAHEVRVEHRHLAVEDEGIGA